MTDPEIDANESLASAEQSERDRLYGYVNGLLGLLQLVRGRDDMPAEIADVLRTNHRATDAAAYLTQIVPPLPPADGVAVSPQDGRAAIDFCGWLSGYLAGCAGKDELTAFEANTIRNTLNEMVFPRGVPTASS